MFRKNNKNVNRLSLDRSLLDHDYLYNKDIFNNSRNFNNPEKSNEKKSKFEEYRRINLKLNCDQKEKDIDKSSNFDEFKKEYSSIMKNYNCNLKNSKNFANVSQNSSFSPEVTNFITKYKNRSHNFENSMMYANVIDEEYKDPIESFIALDNNKKVFGNIMNASSIRLQQKFLEVTDKNKSLDKIIYKKIKITNVAQKNFDLLNVHEKTNRKILK